MRQRCCLLWQTFFQAGRSVKVRRQEKIGSGIERLASGRCEPCEGVDPLTAEQSKEALKDLPDWNLKSGSIEKEFRFKSYLAGLEFAYAIGKIAEEQDHHPDMAVRWRRVKLVFSTHSIGGLSQNDFIMAAKSELNYKRFSGR